MGLAYFICFVTFKWYRIRAGEEMNRFNALEFNQILAGHSQARRSIGKYELSVVHIPSNDTYEIAVTIGTGKKAKFQQLPGIHNGLDLIVELTPYEVDTLIKKIEILAGIK